MARDKRKKGLERIGWDVPPPASSSMEPKHRRSETVHSEREVLNRDRSSSMFLLREQTRYYDTYQRHAT